MLKHVPQYCFHDGMTKTAPSRICLQLAECLTNTCFNASISAEIAALKIFLWQTFCYTPLMLKFSRKLYFSLLVPTGFLAKATIARKAKLLQDANGRLASRKLMELVH